MMSTTGENVTASRHFLDGSCSVTSFRRDLGVCFQRVTDLEGFLQPALLVQTVVGGAVRCGGEPRRFCRYGNCCGVNLYAKLLRGRCFGVRIIKPVFASVFDRVMARRGGIASERNG